MNLDSKYYGLHTRIQLKELGNNHIGIVKLIKSRIIRKDAQKIIEIAKTIQQVEPKYKVSLICTSNICSKSLALLDEYNIDVQIKENV
ncbi:hypothetical protein [Carboxylicivirga caseinilyticus]|uniref:hypothetical protein n=1 Tax=Carboxylicivirga caseinilyticus TaxID=3417572 RepID=UPI003D326812|nr:hypothetical protein [Marinilabiliaceae bacterium A049]